MDTQYNGSEMYCHWCCVSLAGATEVTLLNGTLACCDLCLRIPKIKELQEELEELTKRIVEYELVALNKKEEII